MQFKLISTVLIALVVLAGAFARAAEPRLRPNIVFVLADDFGWKDLACYGSTFHQTPAIDSLAANGMRFTDAYAACNVCSPTRASIMTGKFPARLHLTDWLPGRGDMPSQKLNRPTIIQNLPLEEVTLGEAFKQAGYATGFFGKWHLGSEQFFPDKQGFDVNIGGCALGHPPSYFSPYKIPTLPDGPAGEYLTDRLTDEVIKFIEAHKSGPFLVYLSHYAVHNPQQAKPELVKKYTEKAAALSPAGPEFITDLGRQVRQIQNRPIYAAMVESLDQSVGRITKKLAELGLEQNTIVVFTSDNGGLSTSEGTSTSNLPLRMGKGWNHEGGIREPLIVSWPAVIKPGSTCTEPMISTDYYPTLLEAAGLPARPTQHVDGMSILPLLKGGTMPQRPLFWHYPHYSNQGGPPSGAVRLGDWKLIEWYEDGQVNLYNLKDDIGEHNDLAAKMPEKAAELRRMLADWRTSVDAQMPTVNPAYNSAAANAPAGKKAKAKGRPAQGK
jgi:arylsulfatase A-like enzyme